MELIVIWWCLVLIGATQLSPGRKHRRKAKKEFGTKKPTMIRYDKKDIKNFYTVVVVCAILAVAGIVWIIYLYASGSMTGGLLAEADSFVLAFARSIVGLFTTILIMTMAQIIEAKRYLIELDEHGYYVPENKKDFCYAIEGLPVALEDEDSIIIPTRSEMGRNKDSILLTKISGITTIIMIASTIAYYVKWHFWVEKAWIFLVFICILWILGTIGCFKQSDEKKYRDEIDIDEPGKVRRTLGTGICVFVFYLEFSITIIALFWWMTWYIYQEYIRVYANYISG